LRRHDTRVIGFFAVIAVTLVALPFAVILMLI
jgi:hypothetical protein